MKRGRVVLLALALVFSLALGVVTNPRAGLADFGDFSGDSDWGGSDWGDSDWGDSDWDDDDWGSSDWGSSDWDDDDWGSSDWGSSDWDDDDWGSGYSSSSWDDDGISTALGIGRLLGGFGMGTGITTLITVAVIFWVASRMMNGSRRSGTPSRPTNTSIPKPVVEKPEFRGRDISTYTEVDPSFDISAFRDHLSNLYVRMQHAWTAKDLESVRPFFSAELYAQMERQVQQKVKLGQTNYVERIAVLGVTPKTWYQEGGYDHIVVTVQARIVDYTLDDATGNLVSGSKTAEKFMTYQWDLSRVSGTITQEQAEQVVVNCPNCGAPLNINATAKCPYCDSVIEVKHDDWAITSIKGISQVTR